MNAYEFAARLKAKLAAWYLNNEGEYSACDTCGPYDNRKPSHETVCELIDETLAEMEAEAKKPS